jgi:hypothetical protein
MRLRKLENTGKLKEEALGLLCGERALEEALDLLEADRIMNE